MPNYTLANLVKAQAKLNGAFANADKRFRDPAVFKAFIQSAPFFLPDYEILRKREDRAVEANYFVRQSRALGTGRSHNHTGSSGDSGVLTPSWTTYNDKFSFTLKQADNSVFDAVEEQNERLLNVIANFADGLDGVAATYAFANRSGVNNAAAEGTFNATNDAFEITDATNGNRAVQITRMVMDINKYQGGMFTIFCDSIAFNKFLFGAAQGASNSTNYSFQYQGVNFVHAPQLTASAAALSYTKGFWVAVQEGMIGALPWIPVQNRAGVQTMVNTYGSILNPVDGLQYAVHSYEARANGTSVNGYTQDVLTEVEVSLDVALQHAPLSVASETPLLAFALV